MGLWGHVVIGPSVPGNQICVHYPKTRMQAVLAHLDAIVRPALRNYIAAERALDQANAS